MELGESLMYFFMGGSAIAVTLLVRLSMGVVIDVDTVMGVWIGHLIGCFLIYGVWSIFK